MITPYLRPKATIQQLVDALCGEAPPLVYSRDEGFYAEARIPDSQFPISMEITGSLDEVVAWAYGKKRAYPEAIVTIETPGGNILPVTLDPV